MLNREKLPLSAMRAFEVAARVGTFVGAGAELGVSAAAVSQQVKALEASLGKTLFLRQGNRITLTDAGRTLYPSVESAFAELQRAARTLRATPQQQRLTVSVLPSLAELWLLPALDGFDDRARLDLRCEDDPVDMAREGIDLRVTYGAQYYADHAVDLLFRDRLIAVAAPGFTEDLASTPDADLIHTDWGRDYGTQPDWARHFETLGIRRQLDLTRGTRVDSTGLAVALARSGTGVAVAPSRLVARDLTVGRLVTVGEAGLALPRDYVLVMPNARARNRRLQALREHLLRAEEGAR
jgi:LysR family transcriptional regulator, glycine cleavage system transcriptional activator